jgi:hypothetical protein
MRQIIAKYYKGLTADRFMVASSLRSKLQTGERTRRRGGSARPFSAAPAASAAKIARDRHLASLSTFQIQPQSELSTLGISKNSPLRC